MLGNVGRDAGTLVFKGKFEAASLITGEVEFAEPDASKSASVGVTPV